MNYTKIYPNHQLPVATSCYENSIQQLPNSNHLKPIKLTFTVKTKVCFTWKTCAIMSQNNENSGLDVTLNNGKLFNIKPNNIDQLIRTLKNICNFREGKYKMIVKYANNTKDKKYHFDSLSDTICKCIKFINDSECVKTNF